MNAKVKSLKTDMRDGCFFLTCHIVGEKVGMVYHKTCRPGEEMDEHCIEECCEFVDSVEKVWDGYQAEVGQVDTICHVWYNITDCQIQLFSPGSMQLYLGWDQETLGEKKHHVMTWHGQRLEDLLGPKEAIKWLKDKLKLQCKAADVTLEKVKRLKSKHGSKE